MTDLSIFEYHNHQLRTVMINDQPWFVAKDVCVCLDIKNVSDAVSKIPQDEISLTDTHIGSTDTINYNQSALIGVLLILHDIQKHAAALEERLNNRNNQENLM